MVHTSPNPPARPASLIGNRPPISSLIQQPSNGPLNEQFLISTFMTYLAKPSIEALEQESWMKYLPTFASSSRVMNCSIRATTLAFFARLTDNNDMKVEANWWYATALREERAHVQHLLLHQPASEDVCAPLMLMYYELIRPTATGGWMKHLVAASKLMELTGPENCQTGASHLLFKAVRLLMVFFHSFLDI
jgi:hypothetical protein